MNIRKVVFIFTKKKPVMHVGETEKSVSFKDDNLIELITMFAEESRFTGKIDIDIFEIDGECDVSEVNPRFGGGYPNSFECGCNHMTLIKNNLNGDINGLDIGGYEDGVYMIKYNEIMVK